MTERWRKRLGDIDRATPSEDVFHRAHGGPQMPDEQIPRPSTSSRVVTGIAAFVVFALAIGVFAIPALRMRDQPGAIGGVGVMPLWPARSLEDLQALQQQVDDGGAAWAADPEKVAERFANDVLGWDSANVAEDMGNAVTAVAYEGTGCATIEGATMSPCVEPDILINCRNDGSCPIYDPGPGGLMSTAPVPVYPSSPAYSPYRTFHIAGSMLRLYPYASVRLYQPLDSGDGEIWAVLEVASPGLELSAEAGQQLADGDLLWASERSVEPGALGYRAGTGACDVAGSTGLINHPTANSPGSETPMPSVDYAGGDLTVDLSGAGDGCADSESGYAWAATSLEGAVVDPFAGGGQVRLAGLVAVPVIFSLDGGAPEPTAEQTGTGTFTEGPPATPSPYPSASPVPGDENVNWSTTQALGSFSIDLPNDWVVQDLPGVVEGFWAGEDPLGAPYIEIIVDVQADPADDSTYPLALADLPSEVDEYLFRGDGRQFRLRLYGSAPDGSPTPQEEALLEEIVSSITFEPWQDGEERNGWTALSVFEDPTAESWSLRDQGDGNWVVIYRGQRGLAVLRLVQCGANDPKIDLPSGDLTMRCDDGSLVTYAEDGTPAADNPPGYLEPLDEILAVIAHDESVIALM